MITVEQRTKPHPTPELKWAVVEDGYVASFHDTEDEAQAACAALFKTRAIEADVTGGLHDFIATMCSKHGAKVGTIRSIIREELS